MNPDFEGKVALVTGSSRGIGREIALGLGRGGALVGVHYSGNEDAALETLSRIEAEGGKGFTVQADLTDPDGPKRLADAFLDKVETATGARAFDILVNNAGVGERLTLEQVDPAIFDRVMGVNFRAPFFLTQALAPALRDGGRIVNTSSMGTRMAFPQMAIYAPSKAALENLTELLANHLGPRGITVNAIAPGATVTDMNRLDEDPERAKATASTIALRRVGYPQDVAAVALFLCSSAGGWVTGQCVDASGGQRL
ncbi:MAG: short-chain dehydrogenase [Rhizobiaceae bacterium MnEN-MB40S]|nr:MAG: short-chain dehydrogenase [Rhizobiaceae bacterium MnEN-MB40S]